MTSAPRKAIEVVDMAESHRREVPGPVDTRSGRVAFVSHRLLNENVRYRAARRIQAWSGAPNTT